LKNDRGLRQHSRRHPADRAEDRNRNVRGVSDPLDEEERLANLISDRISPRLIPEIKTLSWRQTQVLALPQASMCGWAPPTAMPMPS
jgi:hypothetical protein